jgi:hypothetical protein
MSTLMAIPGVAPGRPGAGCPNLPLPRPSRTPPWSPENSRQWVFVLTPTSTRTRDTEGVLLSSTVPAGFAMPRTRRQQKAEKAVAYWVGQIGDAKTGRDALNEAWSWLLGALTDLDKRDTKAADAARRHLARQLADFTVKLPEADIEFRAGLTADEERRLFDPWGRRGDAR